MEKKILVVDDNPEIRDILYILLSNNHYTVLTAANGEEAMNQIDDSLDLVLLDIMMPGKSGIKVCEEIRKESMVPILFLTAKTLESDKSLGLLAGGDDYLAKPFSHAELTARVTALIRRYHVYKGKKAGVEEGYILSGDVRIGRSSNEVYRGEEELNLSNLEYDILHLMASHRKKVFSAKNLYESIWNEPYFYSSNSTIMVHIHKLRSKLERDPQKPEHIITVWGKGYKFE
ncbi:MAG: response regulator transcription factor [Lachnospiraceae bacterium]|nr:response regulator transcription factor [Lachnospiraceae bacterium]